MKYSDPPELRRLLTTLVPDVEVSLEGRTFLASGSDGALQQFEELLQELDRPVEQVLVDVVGMSVSRNGFNFLCGGVQPEWFLERMNGGYEQRSGLWARRFPRNHPPSDIQVKLGEGDTELLFSTRLRGTLSEPLSLQLSKGFAEKMFGRSEVELLLELALENETNSKVDAEVRFKAPKRRWYRKMGLRDGELTIVGDARESCLLLVTPHILR